MIHLLVFLWKKRFGYILNGEFGMFASVYRLEWLESLTLVGSLPIFTSHIACLNLKIQWSVIMFHINQSRLNSISSLLVKSIICLFVCLVKNPADWSWKIRLNQTAVLTDRQNTILSWQNQFFFKVGQNPDCSWWIPNSSWSPSFEPRHSREIFDLSDGEAMAITARQVGTWAVG